ncbi:MAG: helix-turn-helix domain-containing protein [Oscillospiraceae bacterium]|jgi:transcriptional regulator with XRE-family HTH domain|nr:helix-turn-helix domain-containing protein [Oscillospiraceae bacterium]
MNNARLTVVNNVRRLLREKGVKQGHIAKQIGVSEKEMSRILSEGRPQPEHRIAAFAEALGVTVAELFEQPT